VPSHLEALLASPWAREVLPRRCLVLGGEAWGWELFERVRELAPACRVLNHYGPTETTVGALAGEVRDGRRSADAPAVPLGRPLPGARAYLLDSRLNGVPTWATAELYLGGDGVTRGYLGCPELTAERFVPDPFGEEPGARLYRTGDLVRCLPDGTLAFVGRVDHQVKIRGHRIEPGEIEAALTQHPAVRSAVALVREDSPGDKRLVAYVVPSPASSPAVNDLRAFLGERLPEYMMPAVFLVLHSLPLSPNGKVDRAALPAPGAVRPELEVIYEAPATELEERIAELWQRALRLEKVGLRDNFFDLGGHSLLLLEVCMELQRSLGREIPIIEMFRYPTIGALAELLSPSGAAAVEPSADDRGRSRRGLLGGQRRRREQRLAN
jgi:acyl carrier protein